MNMDGTALFISISAVFMSQLSGRSLGAAELVIVIVTSFVASLSSAPVPSAALVLLVVVLEAIEIPLQNVGLLYAIDWFV